MDSKYYDGSGNIRISEDVLSTIVSVTAREVDGVHSLTQRAGTDIKGLITPKKSPGKGVRIELQGGQVVVELSIVVKLGVKIQEVVSKLQTDVKQALESMTGMSVSAVNVYVQSMDTSTLVEKAPEPPSSVVEDE